MNLAYKKILGKFTKVLGFGKTPHPMLGKIPKWYRFFFESVPKCPWPRLVQVWHVTSISLISAADCPYQLIVVIHEKCQSVNYNGSIERVFDDPVALLITSLARWENVRPVPEFQRPCPDLISLQLCCTQFLLLFFLLILDHIDMLLFYCLSKLYSSLSLFK